MTTTAQPDSGVGEWRVLRIALLVVVALVLVEVAGTAVDRRLNPGPSSLDQTEKCLVNEKGLPVERGAIDPLAKTADGGVLRTRIEGNAVTILISSSDGRAQRLASEYRNVGGGPANAIDHRGHVVYVWELASSPTQRQTVYDCYY